MAPYIKLHRGGHLLCSVVLLLSVAAGEPHAREGVCRILIVSGLPGAPLFARRYADWVDRFSSYLTAAARVPPGNITTISGDQATAEGVRQALLELADDVTQGDQVVLVLIGHGATTDIVPTILVPGPDLRADVLTDTLAKIPARNQVILNFTGSSGDAVRFLAAPDRVTIAATAVGEKAEPVLAEFFLRGLESARADGEGAPSAGARDGTITLLEAFNWATRQAALWTVRQTSAADGWIVEGRESIGVFKTLNTGPEGEPAVRKLSPASKPVDDDPDLPLRPTNGVIDEYWRGRRIVAEHAVLEDCGEEVGVAALRADGYLPLNGAEPGEPGHLARRVVLGRPGLLAERAE